MLRWLIRAIVSATVVAILLRIVPLSAILNALSRVEAWTWVVSVAVFFAGHYSNAVKLRLLLGSVSIPLSTCVRAQYAGLVANLGLPGLAGGDLVRGAYLVPVAGTRRVALASAADRIIDTLSVIVLVVVAIPMAGVPPILTALMRNAVWWAAVPAGATAILIILLLTHKRRAIARLIGPGWETLRTRGSTLLVAFGISLAVQASFVLTNMWLARQVGVTTAVSAWFVAWPLSKLIAVLPISLGGIGVREAALVSLLAPYGAPREAVLASGILWQSVLTVTGLAGLVVTQMLPRIIAPAPLQTPIEGA